MRIFILISLLIFGSTKTIACICLPNEPIDSSFKDASIIFIGKVSEISKNKLFVNTYGMSFDIINFNIIEGLKKCEGPHKTISLVTQSSSCDYYFEKGKTYIVFGYNEPGGVLTTNQCTRTELLERVDNEELIRLRNLSVNHKGGEYEPLGLVTITNSEHNSLINLVSLLKKSNKRLEYSLIGLLILLFLCLAFLVYLKRENLKATKPKNH
jgi:hypothetical protein